MRTAPLIALLLAGPVSALDVPFRPRPADGGLPGEWLTAFSAGARDAGLANASTALTGAAAAYANPAGIAPTPAGEVSILVAPLPASGQYQALSVSYPLSAYDTLGFSLLHLGSGPAEKTDVLGQSAGSFEEQDLAFLLSYGQRTLGTLYAGFSLKAVRQSVAEFSATGFGADLGIHAKASQDLTLGLSVINIIPPRLKLREKTDTFPVSYRGGATYVLSFLGHPYLLCADVTTIALPGGRRLTRAGAGVEIQPFSANTPLAVRFGMNHREYALGFSVKTGATSFEYAAAFHELETMHRFGITFRYDVLRPLEEKKIRADRLHALKEGAHALLQTGHYDECEKMVLDIREIDEFDAEAPAITAEIKKGREKARSLALKAAQKAEAKHRLAEAKKLYIARQYRKSLETLESHVEFLGDEPLAGLLVAMSRAHVYMEEENYNGALEQLQKAVELEPDNREALLLYGRVRDITGR